MFVVSDRTIIKILQQSPFHLFSIFFMGMDLKIVIFNRKIHLQLTLFGVDYFFQKRQIYLHFTTFGVSEIFYKCQID
jgi:hypothetical protein